MVGAQSVDSVFLLSPGVLWTQDIKRAKNVCANKSTRPSVERAGRHGENRQIGQKVLFAERPYAHCSGRGAEAENRDAVRDFQTRETAFFLYKDSMNTETRIDFMTRLIADSKKKSFLILDNLRVHHAKAVTAWHEKHKAQIELFYLPPYSPEYNGQIRPYIRHHHAERRR